MIDTAALKDLAERYFATIAECDRLDREKERIRLEHRAAAERLGNISQALTEHARQGEPGRSILIGGRLLILDAGGPFIVSGEVVVIP